MATLTTTTAAAVSSHFMTSLQPPKHFSVRSYCSCALGCQHATRVGFSSTPHVLFSGKSLKYLPAICAVLSGTEDIGVSSTQSEDLSITATTSGSGELKISVEVSGTKTQAIFDHVFDKMVAAAQPIPGFRRVKGGKTPNIPRDVLLEVLGPSKVYKQVIKKVINSTVAEYVEKECLKVSKDLRVEQSFEDLEASFEPGEEFSFDAVVHLLK
ncbi:PREDICTED: uncharacterized protein LOC101310860 [Fragaria vesca subsp. vesca]|uniref:uncharacterized protein LOC101310860 n=1 Tax=Fragaria vesca subsp. vesca TaxID=101020 RepID=UPI0002C2EA33|nr:PREDICTED: uncharacterized protein LOC101310860 [Fragaria vesca subsp. vesca]